MLRDNVWRSTFSRRKQYNSIRVSLPFSYRRLSSFPTAVIRTFHVNTRPNYRHFGRRRLTVAEKTSRFGQMDSVQILGYCFSTVSRVFWGLTCSPNTLTKLVYIGVFVIDSLARMLKNAQPNHNFGWDFAIQCTRSNPCFRLMHISSNHFRQGIGDG